MWTGETGVILQVGCCFTGVWRRGREQLREASPPPQSPDSSSAWTASSNGASSTSDNGDLPATNAPTAGNADQVENAEHNVGSTGNQRRRSTRVSVPPKLPNILEEFSDARQRAHHRLSHSSSGSMDIRPARASNPSNVASNIAKSSVDGAVIGGTHLLDGTNETASSSRLRNWSQRLKARTRTFLPASFHETVLLARSPFYAHSQQRVDEGHEGHVSSSASEASPNLPGGSMAGTHHTFSVIARQPDDIGASSPDTDEEMSDHGVPEREVERDGVVVYKVPRDRVVDEE